MYGRLENEPGEAQSEVTGAAQKALYL